MVETIKFDLDVFVRENAVIVYKEKVYFDVNHQYAFELALNDEKERMVLDLNSRDIFIAEEMVNDAYRKGLISTWHWLSDDRSYYLVCNFKDDFFKYHKLKTIQEFVKKHNMKLGYFVNRDEFLIVS